MSTQFALDLRLVRRKSGLTQRDCAHLLAIHPSRLSDLERGKHLPSLPEICTLSLMYDRSFESLYGTLFAEARANLRTRLISLPKDTREYVGTMNRDSSLDRLAQRLAAEVDDHGGA